MFVEAHVELPVCAPLAQRGLLVALVDPALQQDALGAYTEGIGRLDALPRQAVVHARVLAPRPVARAVVTPLRWEVDLGSERLHRLLDANICITAVDSEASLLTLVGSYAPPPGRDRAAVDRVALAGAVQTSMNELVERLGRAITPTEAAPARAGR